MINTTDREEILRLIKTASNARTIYRANALNLRYKGFSAAEVANFIEITPRTVFNIEKNYEEGGLKKALYDDPRPESPCQFDDRIKSQLIALVCSNPPEGFDRWTLELIKQKAIKNKIVPSISRETIRVILQEHDLKPWRQKSWCVPALDEEFIERMEDVLSVYEKDYDPKKPVVCVDEKPIQLLSDSRPSSGIVPGEIKKVDYEYKRMGTANVFCAVEPKKGFYYNSVTERRTGSDFGKFLSAIAEHYSEAEKIILVLDNLNIHRLSSLETLYPPEEAKALWERFEIHYTPKHGSWLNQAEIAINMYARQCLGKTRIPDLVTLKKRTKGWLNYINRTSVKIAWKFTTKKAREKFQYG